MLKPCVQHDTIAFAGEHVEMAISRLHTGGRRKGAFSPWVIQIINVSLQVEYLDVTVQIPQQSHNAALI